jgi:D-glycero-alpha-D-manno-heptose 1-phosphate guanylyltransferase
MSEFPRKALILAGGLGTRLKSVVPVTPKPLAHCSGKAFIDWLIDHLKCQGVGDFVISAGYRAEDFVEHFKGRKEIDVIIEKEALGTAGAMAFAVENTKFKDLRPWLVCNGDSIVFDSIEPLYSHFNNEFIGTMLSLYQSDCSRFGKVEFNNENILTAFREKIPGPGYINAGVFLMKSNFTDSFNKSLRPLSFEKELLPSWLNDSKKIGVITTKAPFIDIGTPETYEQSNDFLIKEWEKFYGMQSL